MEKILQLALDYENLEESLRIAGEAVKGGVDWLEAGTPLIKSEGLKAVRVLKDMFPDRIIVADLKTIDAGRLEVECACKAGAGVVHVLGYASESTIKEAVATAQRYNARVVVDLIGFEDEAEAVRIATLAEKCGAFAVCVHTPIDLQMRGEVPFSLLRSVVSCVNIPVGVAGGINSENAAEAVKRGASIIIVGGAITKAKNAEEAARIIKNVILTEIPEKAELFKRHEDISVILKRVSSADVCDAMHNHGFIPEIKPLWSGIKMIGKAYTVWTYPGDWSKPVQAIDRAPRGSVIVIDAGGIPPAVWGEKATMSSINRGLAGVVINGAIRDTAAIKEMKFPAFARMICSAAGEPKGMGMFEVPLKFGTVTVKTGDWLIGDDDGVVVVPSEKAMEFANRAQTVFEREGREMKEITDGLTYGKVAELGKWDMYAREK